MAYTLYRFGRFLRSICAPIMLIVGFSCLLTFIFILYQPTIGPGEIQKLGWQSWDIISMQAPHDNTAIGQNQPGQVSSHEGVDWWNVTAQEENVDFASLPLDVWTPLMPHDTGLSEIAITRCMFYPGLADLCSPPTTIEQDAIKGKWVRVDRNLNAQAGMWYLNMYYRRTRRLDVPLIVEIRLLPQDEEPTTMSTSWHKVSRSIRDGIRNAPPLFLWYRTGETQREISVKGSREEIITELDVLFGEDRPWYGFERLYPAVTEEKQGRFESVYVTYRKGVKFPPKAPPLHFSHDGKFKVLQVADLHYSVSRGSCRDTVLSPCENSDNLTSTLIGRALDAEKPSLVVFSGDQLNGQGTSWDPKSVLAKFSRAVEERGIPWAAVFGNHDDEDGANRSKQIQLMQALPYNLVEAGPKDVHGVGNYVLKVKSADPSMTHLLTLYFLDSGSYYKGIIDFWGFGFFTPTEYDYIHQSQTDWFLQQSSEIKPIERPFSPHGAKDLGSLWTRQSGNQVTTHAKRLAKPNALMFFHIPIPETYGTADKDPYTGKALDVGLHDTEPMGSPKKNDGFFENGLLRALESDHRADGNAREVKVVANGHCHITENCRRIRGIWSCFGGGGSYSGYGKVGFDRRFRVYDISDYGETIRTYKRTEHDEILDSMILSGSGAPPPYEGTR